MRFQTNPAAVSAPTPVPVFARSRAAIMTVLAPLSVTETVRALVPKSATPLNFSVVNAVNCACRAVNSES